MCVLIFTFVVKYTTNSPHDVCTGLEACSVGPEWSVHPT